MELYKQIDVLISNFPGSSVNVRVRSDEPIQFVLDRITNTLSGTGIMGDSQITRLYLDGKMIDDYGKSIKYYSLFGNVWTYKNGDAGTPTSRYRDKLNNNNDKEKVVIQFFVVGLTGKTISCRLDHYQTIYDLKKVLEIKERVPMNYQRLVYSGKHLENDITLEDYNVTTDSTIYLLLRLLGGRPFPTLQFANVSDINGRSKRKIYDWSPRGRLVKDGINIELRCSCTAYMVIHPYGFGYFDLHDTLTPCPNCGSNTYSVPTTAGFVSCHYRIHGLKKDGSQFKSDWTRVAPEDQYQIYDTSKQADWRRLGIEARPLTASISEPCTICLEPLDGHQKKVGITTLKCSHQFHTECIAAWKLNNCPVCRAISARSSL